MNLYNFLQGCNGSVFRWHGYPTNRSEVFSTLFKAKQKYNVVTKLKGFNSHKVLTAYGACTTFNMLKKSFFKEKWMDDEFGMLKDGEVEDNWTLDSENKTEFDWWKATIEMLSKPVHFCNRGNGTKYKVIVHPSDEIATVYHSAFELEYGKPKQIVVKLKSERSNENIRVLHPDVRKCYFEDEGNLKYFKRYSRSYCQLECLSKLSSCHPLEIPSIKKLNGGYCEANSLYVRHFDDHKFGMKECKCLPKCNNIKYEIIENEPNNPAMKGNATIFEVKPFNYVEETEKFITYTIANCKKIIIVKKVS